MFLFPGATGTIAGNAVTLPGYWPFNAAASPAGFGGPQNLGQVYENLTYTRGSHQFKFGGQFFYFQNNNFFGAYQNAVESLGTQGNYALALNNFVTGNINQFQSAVYPQGKFPGESVTLPVGPPDFTRSNRYNEWAGYVNDSFHWSPRLVLNLGLRYEYYGVQHNKDPNLDSNFYFGRDDVAAADSHGSVQIANSSPVGGLWPGQEQLCARVGFALDLFGDGKTSLRWLRPGLRTELWQRHLQPDSESTKLRGAFALNGTAAGQVPNLPITNNNAGPLAGTTPPTKVLPATSLRHVREDTSTPMLISTALLSTEMGQAM